MTKPDTKSATDEKSVEEILRHARPEQIRRLLRDMWATGTRQPTHDGPERLQ